MKRRRGPRPDFRIDGDAGRRLYLRRRKRRMTMTVTAVRQADLAGDARPGVDSLGVNLDAETLRALGLRCLQEAARLARARG